MVGGIARPPFLLICLCNKIVCAPFEQSKVPVPYTIFDLSAVYRSKKKATACSSSPHEALFPLIGHFIVEPEAKDILRCLIALSDATIQDSSFVELTVMVAHRTDRVDMVRRYYMGLLLDTEAVSTLCNSKSIVRVRLRELEKLLSRRFRDVALRLCNRDGELCSEPLHQCLAHDTHEGGVSRGAALAYPELLVGMDAEVELLVAILTERAIVVRSIPSVLAALEMMDIQLDGLLIRSFDTTAGAGVVISPENVLAYVIGAVHLTLLIVFTFRDGSPILNGFEELKVELCCFNDYLADRQDSAYSLDGSNMFLYLHFHRWSEPSLVFAVDAVVEARLPIPCGTVPACAAELSPRGELFHHIIPRQNLCSKQFLLRRTCRHSDGLASCIYAENDRLGILGAPIEELDGEGRPFDDLCFPVI